MESFLQAGTECPYYAFDSHNNGIHICDLLDAKYGADSWSYRPAGKDGPIICRKKQLCITLQPPPEEISVETPRLLELESCGESTSESTTTRPALEAYQSASIPSTIASNKTLASNAADYVIQKILSGFKALNIKESTERVTLFVYATKNRQDLAWQNNLPRLYEQMGGTKKRKGKSVAWCADLAATTTRLLRRSYDKNYSETKDLKKEKQLKRREKIPRMLWGSINKLIKVTRRPEPIGIIDALAEMNCYFSDIIKNVGKEFIPDIIILIVERLKSYDFPSLTPGTKIRHHLAMICWNSNKSYVEACNRMGFEYLSWVGLGIPARLDEMARQWLAITNSPTWESTPTKRRQAMKKTVEKRGIRTLTISMSALRLLPSYQPDRDLNPIANGSRVSPRAENGAALADCWRLPELTGSEPSDISDTADSDKDQDNGEFACPPAHEILASMRFNPGSIRGNSMPSEMSYSLSNDAEYLPDDGVGNAETMAPSDASEVEDASSTIMELTLRSQNGTSQYSTLKRTVDVLQATNTDFAKRQATEHTREISRQLTVETIAKDTTQDRLSFLGSIEDIQVHSPDTLDFLDECVLLAGDKFDDLDYSNDGAGN